MKRTEADKAAMPVRGLYEAVLKGWNARDGAAYAAPFAPDGRVIGFDGSQHVGRDGIAAGMTDIFANHPSTGRYVWIIREVRPVGTTAAVLRADVGMVAVGHTTTNPVINATQTVVAEHIDGAWQIVLFQNTPAAFHDHPEQAEQLTAELDAIAGRGG
jgi:uncharacterized protein (TIGR02246 family)